MLVCWCDWSVVRHYCYRADDAMRRPVDLFIKDPDSFIKDPDSFIIDPDSFIDPDPLAEIQICSPK